MPKILLKVLLTKAAKAPVYLYRGLISPFMTPACRFHPTCSAYALEAFESHGPFKGAVLALSRILRCHPWGRSGADPVPVTFNWAFDWRGFFGYKRP